MASSLVEDVMSVCRLISLLARLLLGFGENRENGDIAYEHYHLFLKKESFNAKEQVGEAHARATELEKQVEDLKNEIAKQKTKKDAFEPRINVAETKISELNEKLEKLQKTNEEQKIRIRNTERALKKAEAMETQDKVQKWA
ncbi:hypothetical protein L2E82_17489 [Cichorium intybus]|uniref:Uncharacterized protein n=1 Tax=Cichorium intybus TaxID=13427 RepID=A0ACB9F8W4_CICIN|nr:hypothetical protein L2E82_17489 [Cichorium intybus]